jgi:hypothetical protein
MSQAAGLVTGRHRGHRGCAAAVAHTVRLAGIPRSVPHSRVVLTRGRLCAVADLSPGKTRPTGRAHLHPHVGGGLVHAA